jgi:SAM-dependent methyltransferase
MAQNIYDKKEFLEAYSKLPRSVQGLNGAPEWPTLRRLIGNVKDSSVLDLGCGMGWFCRWAREAGGKNIDGLDISESMLERARSFDLEKSSGITYECKNLETITLEPAAYDLVYSSLTLHYLSSIEPLFMQTFGSLRPNGRFIFSIEHPTMTAPSDPAFKRAENGHVFWPLNNYIEEGLRETEWLGTSGVKKYHRTVETYLMSLIKCGFVLTAVLESWDGMERSTTADKEDWGGHKPFFLIVAAQRLN